MPSASATYLAKRKPGREIAPKTNHFAQTYNEKMSPCINIGHKKKTPAQDTGLGSIPLARFYMSPLYMNELHPRPCFTGSLFFTTSRIL